MKKIIHKIAGLALGLSLAMGVGVVAFENNKRISPVSAGDNDFTLFSGTLEEGDYLVVYAGGAMNTTVSSSRLGYEEVTVTNNVITTTEASIIWHIAPSGDYWTLYNADADAYAAGTGAKNKAQMLADGTDNKSLWTVSGNSTYEFVNKANAAAGVNANLRRNGTYGFACYAAGTGGALSLYKKTSGGGEQNTFTVTFNSNGGSSVSAYTDIPKDSIIEKPADPTKDNCTFAGWFTDSALTNEYNFSSKVTSSFTLYAKWELDLQHEGSQADPFDGGDAYLLGSSLQKGSSTTEYYYTSGVVQSFEETFNANYGNYSFKIESNFICWRLKNGSSQAKFNAGDIEIGDTVVVYTQIQNYNGKPETKGGYVVSVTKPVVETKYTVTFNANGGETPEPTKEVGEGLSFTFPTAGTVDNKVFKGWSSDGGEHFKQEGDQSDAVIADITYTAYWTTEGSQADPYTVSEAIAAIDGNYGLKNIYVSGIISQVDSFSSGAITYWISEDGSTDNQFEVYKGKNIGNENFTAKENVEVGASVTIFGNIKKFNTTYEFDSGNYLVAYSAPSHLLTGIALSGTYQTSFEQGAAFNYEGLVVTASYDGAADKEVTPTSVSSPDMNVLGEQEVTVSYTEEEVTKTASYTITVTAPVAKHTVSFNHGDGTGEMDSVLVNDGASYALPECTFIAPEGKVFAGWTLNGTDKVTALESVTADVEVTALWEDAPEETTVAYIFSEHYDANTTIDGEVIALDGAVSVTFNKREGGTATQYYVNGEAVRWYGGGTLLIESSSGAITSIVITFKGGHTNNVTADVGTYEESIDSSSGTGTWSGNSSSVLFTQAGTSGNDRISQISVTYSGSSVPPSPVSYTVTYSANGGTGNLEDANSPYQSGTSVTTLENSFTRDGYAFIEWNTSADGNGISYAEGATFNINGNTTLYAIWEQNGGGGSVVAGRCYSLVEDESELVAGAKYVIAASNDNGDYAMSTIQNNNNRAKEEIEISNGVAVVSSDAVQVVTLSGSEGAWNFGVSGGYLYASSSSSNQLKTEAEIDDNGNANWAITLSNGIASIVAQGTSTRKVMQYNAGSSLFACYASNSQTEVSLYRLDFEATLLHNITCDGNGSHTFADGYSWSDLEVVYGDLPEAEKSALAAIEEPVADSGLERYDYLVAKYEFKNFISRDVTYVGMAPVVYHVGESNTSTIIIVVVALTSITSIGVLLVIKRRRTLMN